MANKRVLYVGGLSEEVDLKILYGAFIPFGDVVDVQMPIDYQTQKQRGFGFVEFENAEDAKAAIDNINDSEIFGKTIRVNLAKPTKLSQYYNKPVWTTDEWLKEHAGETLELKEDNEDNIENTDASTQVENTPNFPPLGPQKIVTCFMDMSIDGQHIGRITFILRADIAPITCENFRKLCSHTCGYGYRGSKMHRIIPGFMCQGGDFEKGDGTGGKCTFHEKRHFNDENFTLQHSARGTVAMANSGPNTNGSQFFITFAPTDWLNGKHVVFAAVTESSLIVLRKIESAGSESGKPTKRVVIEDCGELK